MLKRHDGFVMAKTYLRELATALFHCRRQNRRLFRSRLEVVADIFLAIAH